MTLHALVLLTALSSPGETVLLEFTTTGCAPCQAMQPIVQRLQRERYPVRQVNIAVDGQTAARFRVYQVPCFVMVVNGREVERVVGATSYQRLVSIIRTGTRRATAAPPVAPVSAAVSIQPPAIRPAETLVRPTSVVTPRSSGSPQQRALAATVRLRVEDARGTSFGTGTVIDTHGSEALVLTCGHLFRDSQGAGEIHVDLFVNGKTRTVRGELIAYDAQQDDVGLVSIRPGTILTPVSVATSGVNAGSGQQVFAVGCNRGAGPTVLLSKIAGVNRFVGSPNYTVPGRPLDGRSGGGLFTADGQLIGLCKWAVTDADEGVYAGLAAVHKHLAKAGLQSVFESVVSRDSQVVPAAAIATTPKMTSPVTLIEPPSLVLGQGVPIGVDSNQVRDAEYAAKLQALEKAYQISRESLRREYQQPSTSGLPTLKR
ncbi:MAG: trypsin-like peptidase domain-containing protein [Pirellulaceae bacterium]